MTPAFFNNTLYIIDANDRIGAYTITNAVFNTTPVETPDTYDNKGGATACISANGASNAIAWVIYNAGGESPTTPCILRAYNATNLTQELYSSDQLASRDSAGDAVKFTVAHHCQRQGLCRGAICPDGLWAGAAFCQHARHQSRRRRLHQFE